MFQSISQVASRAPELTGGVAWFNSEPIEIYRLKNKLVLVDFWTYSCVNCIRTLPHLVSWYRKYAKDGLLVIGVHTPEFEFEKDNNNIKRALVAFGIGYPVVSDANYTIWHAFANHVWPRKFLIDKNFKVRYDHAGEGNYGETEQAIRKLLLEINPNLKFTTTISADHHHVFKTGSVCFPQSPETYFGYTSGVLGNNGGFIKDQVAKYRQGRPGQGRFYLSGKWRATGEYVESEEEGSFLEMIIKGVEVNLVAVSYKKANIGRVEIELGGKPLEVGILGSDVKFSDGKSFLEVSAPRMYQIIKSRNFLHEKLRLTCKEIGLRFFSFTFGGCVS